jgi:hypothetical protein
VAALAVAVFAGLWLLVPLHWPIALPISGVAVVLASAAVVAAVTSGRSPVPAALVVVLCLAVLIVAAVAVVNLQRNLAGL